MAGENTVSKDQAIKILRQYRQAVREAGITVTDLILFGSIAKSSAHAGSDIDVAVVSGSFGVDYHEELGQNFSKPNISAKSSCYFHKIKSRIIGYIKTSSIPLRD